MSTDENTTNASSIGRNRRFAAIKIQLSSNLPDSVRQGLENVRRWLNDNPEDQEIFIFLTNIFREVSTLQNDIMELLRDMKRKGSKIASITLSELTADIQELMAEAGDAYYVADFDRAIQLYQKVVRLAPTNRQAWDRLVKAEANKIDGMGRQNIPREALRWFRNARSYIAAKDYRAASIYLNAAVEESRAQGVDFSDAEELLVTIQKLSASKGISHGTITIVLDCDPAGFISTEQEKFIITLSRILQINSDQIKVVKISEGSVVITLVIPDASVRHLLSLFLEEDMRLRNLGIKKLYLEQSDVNSQSIPAVSNVDTSGIRQEIGVSSPIIQNLVPKIFISYSHTDERFKNELVKMLIPLEDQGLFEIWQDRKIVPGDEWYQDIQDAMNTCTLALLLISSDFLVSDFIQKEEITHLLQRRKDDGLRVIPIIIRHCVWQSVPVLKDLQALPKDGKPIISFERTGQRDLVWTQVVSSIKDLL